MKNPGVAVWGVIPESLEDFTQGSDVGIKGGMEGKGPAWGLGRSWNRLQGGGGSLPGPWQGQERWRDVIRSQYVESKHNVFFFIYI